MNSMLLVFLFYYIEGLSTRVEERLRNGGFYSRNFEGRDSFLFYFPYQFYL